MSSPAVIQETSPATEPSLPDGSFSFILPLSFKEGSYYADDVNEDALLALKESIVVMSDEHPLAANQVGKMAAGLVTGRVSRIHTSTPTGLYGLSEGGKGITFFRPDILLDRWEEVEPGVGGSMQRAMTSMIELLTDPTPLELHLDFDVATSR